MAGGQGRITDGGRGERRRPEGWGRKARAGAAGTAGARHAGAGGLAHARPGSECGSVTAEVAVVLPALVVLIALLLGTAQVGAAQLRLDAAARAGAREAMRGESSMAVEHTVQRLAGPGAVARMTTGGGWAIVEVRTTVDGPIVGLMDLELQATASGREEYP